MTKWHDYYKDWTVKDYNRHIRAWKGFCHIVARHSTGKNLLELGFGTGQMSIYLSLKGYKVVGIDKNEIQVKRAMSLASQLKAKPVFDWCDLFEYKNPYPFKFDAVFSQGLLEHYTDQQIKQIFDLSFKLGNRVAFSVPLDKFGHKSRGDERLLPDTHWKALVSNYKILHWSKFADDKQLAAVIK